MAIKQVKSKFNKKALVVIVFTILLIAVVALLANRITGNVINGNVIKSTNQIQTQVDMQKELLAKLNETVNGLNASSELKDAINEQLGAIYSASYNIEKNNDELSHTGGGGSGGGSPPFPGY